MKNKKSIIFIHLLNNFSGSPNVLATVSREFYKHGINTALLTSFNNHGFLSDIPSNRRINISYTFHRNILTRTLALVKFQFLSAFNVMQLHKSEIVYINTILPFLPALAAHYRGMKVIYHIHEAYAKLGLFQKVCFWAADKSSFKIICVSQYVKDNLSERARKKAIVVYNSLDSSFTDNVREKEYQAVKTVLMVSSAREYKGIFEFCKLAADLPQYKFVLVCDANETEIKTIFSEKNINLPNLQIYPTQENLHPFYSSADLILNLSNPKLIIETFGLTVLEAMYYAVPAIVPPVGGITELVDEGVNGLKINVNDLEQLKKGVSYILENPDIYKKMSENAKVKAEKFNRFSQLQKIINEVL